MSPRQRSASKWLESLKALNCFESAGLRVGNIPENATRDPSESCSCSYP